MSFEQLKESFAMFMRFYAYNQHVYSDSVLKILMMCNQHYLNTYKNVYELMRQVRMHEKYQYEQQKQQQQQKQLNTDVVDIASDTNATKNSSTVSSFVVGRGGRGGGDGNDDDDDWMLNSTSVRDIYDLYANTDMSYIFRKVLVSFEHNDPALNRACIDFLDAYMFECSRPDRLFHTNLALPLANITQLESFRALDQRIKDLISNILVEIRRLCKHKPRHANKILFDVRRHTSASPAAAAARQPRPGNQKKRSLTEEFSDDTASYNKRSRLGPPPFNSHHYHPTYIV